MSYICLLDLSLYIDDNIYLHWMKRHVVLFEDVGLLRIECIYFILSPGEDKYTRHATLTPVYWRAVSVFTDLLRRASHAPPRVFAHNLRLHYGRPFV